MLGCSCQQADWLAWRGTRRLREVAPPPLISSRDKPAACLLCCVESSCLSSSLSRCLSLFVISSLSSSQLFPLFLPVRLPHSSSSSCLYQPPLHFFCASAGPHHLTLSLFPLCFQHTIPTHYPIAKIMTLLTTQTRGGSYFSTGEKLPSLQHQSHHWHLSPVGREREN